ncbi:helix-turn-helix domain-containing protein [Actinomadura rubrisoli]|uniref:Helix-turn-helix domain-containing protein n=1 Tax=Actinomadura rubrisoli TaxID=2530368 RepID=A0A4R5AWQ5_9ACTN|nr:helix-turn-helix domain-containing protein [Actinomadura rubrisoli]TDD76166.1 helix-turn-helix domain-containing protein [Actinomadura rubrisoli]
MHDEITIGARLRILRRWRGLSLTTLADMAGLSQGFLSKVENGKLPLDRRSHIAAVATALRVSEKDLVGGPHLTQDPVQSSAHTTVPALRIALTANTLDDAAADFARPLAELAAELDGPVHRAEKGADYATRGGLLAPILDELHVHTAGGTEADQLRALSLLVQACYGTAMTLRFLGYDDLALMAASRALEAAQRLEDPLILGRAAWVRVQTLPRGVGANVRIATKAADRLQGADGTAELDTYGMLHLSAAMGAAAANDLDAADRHLAEAAEAADRVGDRPDAWGDFGPTNVGVWGVAVATEVGDYEGAVRGAETVDPERLVNRERQAMFHADIGRALAHLPGRQRDAVSALVTAERIAPQRIRNSSPARHAIEVMLEQAKAAAVGRELRGMAARMGVPH